jgi:adenylate cyclase
MPSIRQLAAIMFTDIVGYTALMGNDEQKAFDILRQNRELQRPLIEQYGGKWIKELGDGVLASFNTVSDAVQAAIKIQKACNRSKDFSLRIGIHQGEVVFEENDIFGDSVNIASRIQALAPIGGIWVSETVHHNISNKQGITTKFVKEEILKNVREPVKIYEVNTEYEVSVTTATMKKESKTTQEKSIAVLPFVNMSSDAEQEYFSDGLTEEIITDLSHLKNLLVISRSSMMTFKGTNKKMKEIAAEVNARYLLEGSVRKSGNNLRITAQLIDAENDSHLWAEKYSGTIDDIFDIQEKVSLSIVEALNIQLTGKEESFLVTHHIPNTQAYEWYIKAKQEMMMRTEHGLENAIALAQRGLDLIGDNALLYSILSTANLYFYHHGIRSDSSYLDKAHAYATKSLTLDATSPQAHLVQGILAFKKQKVQEASFLFKRVLELEPNNVDAMIWQSVMYFLSGRPDAAEPIVIKVFQLDPVTIVAKLLKGTVAFYCGNTEEALPYYQSWYEVDAESPWCRFNYSWVLAMSNNIEESIKVLESLMKDTPTSPFGRFALFFKSALLEEKDQTLRYATAELKREAACIDYLTLNMAWGYALIREKDEAVWWLNKSLEFGYSPYPLMLKWKTFHHVLKDHPGFQTYMQEIKRRSEQFIISDP